MTRRTFLDQRSRSRSLDTSKGLLSDMLRDIGLTRRSLRRSPLFTALTVATPSLGIGATTAACSFVEGILLSPLPCRHPDRREN